MYLFARLKPDVSIEQARGGPGHCVRARAGVPADASTGAALHVRYAGEPSQAIASVRRELQAIDPAMPPGLTVTLTDYIGAAYLAQRAAALLLGALALLALILAAVGPLKSDNLVH